MSDYTLTIARSLEDIENLRTVWQEMVTHPNVDFDMFSMFVECRNEVERPHVISVSQNDAIKTILVGRVEQVSLTSKLGYRTVFKSKVASLAILHGGLLGDESPQICQLLVHTLQNSLSNEEFDLIYINKAKVDAVLFNQMVKSSNGFWIEKPRNPMIHWELELPNSIEDIYNMRSAKTRSTMRRKERNINNTFQDRMEIVKYKDGANLKKIMSDIESVAKDTYQRSLSVGFANNREWERRFDIGFKNSSLLIYVMYLDGEAIAYIFGFIVKDRFFFDIPGYKSEHRKLYIGEFLRMHVLGDLCKDPSINFFDYGFGDAAYKRETSTGHWLENDARIFQPSLKYIPIILVRYAISIANGVATYVSRKFDFEALLKRLARKRITRKN